MVNQVAFVALWLAVVASVAGAITRRSRLALMSAAILLWLDVAWLGSRLATLDLSLVYVVDYARSGVTAPFRVAGLWGGPSGSLLLFTAGVATIAAVVRPRREFAVRALAATVAVLAATVAFANPFRQLAIPAISGSGMQPVLEHWAMLIHPPILYLGLVLAAGVWAHAVGGSDAQRVQLWSLATFATLTIGQLLGSNWAYVELGWGGYWAWDPVENGIAVAWFILVAAVHSARLPEIASRSVAAAAWVAVLFAAFVTRSGGGGSVHAFADDRGTGSILAALVVATTATTAFAVRRVARAEVGGPADASAAAPVILNRRLVIIVSSLAAALVVMIGLLYPLFAPGEQVVNGTYFARLIAPLGIIAVAAVGLSFLRWVGPRTGLLLMAGTAVGGTIGWEFGHGTFARSIAIAAGLSGAGLVAGNYQRWRVGRPIRWHVVTAHLGVVVMAIGVAGSTQGTHEVRAVTTGESFEVGGVTFEHRAIVPNRDGDIEQLTATLVASQGRNRTELHPSVRSFPDRAVVLAETAVISRPRRDIVVVMAGATELGLARYEITVTPLVQLVWWGAALIGVGAAAAAVSHYRSRDCRRCAKSASSVADSAR